MTPVNIMAVRCSVLMHVTSMVVVMFIRVPGLVLDLYRMKSDIPCSETLGQFHPVP